MKKFIARAKGLILSLSILALIAINILSLTSSAINSALSGLLSTAFGVQTISDTLRNTLDAKNRTIKKQTTAHLRHKAATRRFGTRLASRTRRVAAESVAAIPGEAIPMLGISLLIAGTTYELYEACISMNDLTELYSNMGMEDEVPDDVLQSVCDPSLPGVGNFWDGMVEKSGNWWNNQ